MQVCVKLSSPIQPWAFVGCGRILPQKILMDLNNFKQCCQLTASSRQLDSLWKVKGSDDGDCPLWRRPIIVANVLHGCVSHKMASVWPSVVCLVLQRWQSRELVCVCNCFGNSCSPHSENLKLILECQVEETELVSFKLVPLRIFASLSLNHGFPGNVSQSWFETHTVVAVYINNSMHV